MQHKSIQYNKGVCMNTIQIAELFAFEGKVLSVSPYGDGHINDTFLVVTDKDTSYILQRLNTKIFHNYAGLMDNIRKVSAYLADIISKDGGDVSRECLTLVHTRDGKPYEVIGEDCWRAYIFVKDSKVYQLIDSPEIFENTGEAFGKFIARLDGFDASTLCEVIPDFHNTVDRYEKFLQAVENNKSGRRDNVLKEIEFVKARKDFMHTIVDALAKGEIPLRVTHNDTKLNNVLIDKSTGKAICIIDLDTIMPGSLLYDFGDSVRFGCNTALEDEKDLSKVSFDKELYKAYCTGFLRGIGDKITQKEIDMLHIGSIMMTLECGTRFLTDYLDGDVYFKTAYPEHNLVRCHTQFKLVECMENASDEMIKIAKTAKYN